MMTTPTSRLLFVISLWLSLACPMDGATVLPFEAERALLPITVRDAAGAYGTRWTTELWSRSEDGPAGFYPFLAPSFCDPPCPEPAVFPDDSSYQLDFFRTHPGESDGMLLYINKNRLLSTHISLQLNETSGRYKFTPLQLPVVRERDFTTRTVHIPGVPAGNGSRVTLRVYGIDPALPGEVRIRMFSEDPPLPQMIVLDRVISLSAVPLVYQFDVYSFDLRPPVAVLDLTPLIPGGLGRVRMELTPATPKLAIWGFVSLTDNATQAITLRTPD